MAAIIDIILATILPLAALGHRKVAPALCPGPVDPAVYADIGITEAGNRSVESHATAWYSDCWGSRAGGVQGTHAIDAADDNCMTCPAYAECESPFNTPTDQEYSGTINDAAECGFAYWGDIEVISFAYGGLYGLRNRFQTSTISVANACDPPDTNPIIIYEDSDCPQHQNCHSPIVVNMTNGNYELSGTSDPVLFDIDASDKPIRIAWTAAGTPMAFLALDRNNNGRVDDGSELFGNHTPLPGGATAANGFEALAPYDANHDLVIDSSDPVWASLTLWTDLNHDGISQAAELLPASRSSLVAISLSHHWSGRSDPSGNHFRYQSRIWLSHGNRPTTAKPVYDIFFVAAQ